MSVEPFIYLLLFLFFGLMTFVFRWLKGEMEKSDFEGESKVLGLFRESPPPAVPRAKRHEARERRKREVSSLAPPRPVRTGRKVRKMKVHTGNLQEMQRGIVLMAVLGPCRALEPPNESFRF